MTSDLRKSVPPPLAPVAFDIPQPHHESLANGLRIVVFEDERLPLVSFRLAFHTGDINDPVESVGITSAIAAMLTEGTEKYTSFQLAEKIERLGASLSSSASDDFTIVSASCLSLYSSEVLTLLSEVVLRPTFPEEELDLYKRNTVEHLKFQRSQPGFLAGEQAARLIFGTHPYSRVSPKPADIEKLGRQALIRRHTEIFVPNDAVLVVIGDVKRDELLRELRDHFGDWQTGVKEKSEFGRSPARSERTLTVVDRPGSAQSNIVLANLGIERDHPDYFPLIVMNQVLGAGASSRIFMNLREEKGYTYGAYTRLDTKQLAGSFEATAEVRTPVTRDSLKEFFYELNRIRETRVGDEELRDAKEFLTGVFPLRAETQEGLTNLVLNQHIFGLPEDYLQTYRENINKISPDDVQRVANAHVRPAEVAIVIVGDAEEVLPQIREYADTLEVFDTEGKQQDASKFAAIPASELADAAGKWNLTIDFQGQNLPVSLTLEQDGAAITGELNTMLGNGTISDGKINGNKISATVQAEMQGQPVEFAISGKLDGDAMSGTIATPMVPAPLPFTGSRDGTAQKSAAE